MAIAKVKFVDEEDNLLTCSICLEMFKNPKYLPCLHTFCKLCIHSYIQSLVSQEIINKGFKCPVCRTFVPVGDHSSNSECWAEELPNNHLIISMIDRKALQKQDKLCNVCELSNINQEAVSWCSVCQEALCTVCENCHRKFLKYPPTIKLLRWKRYKETEFHMFLDCPHVNTIWINLSKCFA
ncbi:Hypothetical predicted protein [Mytilus galloprovincialis]|uniref:Uncharacterized protein n=1 Tax=Mytilus galloprovincialis TaxID=29158 RepID=A0A8B6C7H7_MYTGA|nr:Hypothetical predicted protein [Mytilus galloprovincialis]